MDGRLLVAAAVIGGLVLYAKSKAATAESSPATTAPPGSSLPNGATVSTPISDRPQIPSTGVAIYRSEDGTRILTLLQYLPDGRVQFQEDGEVKTLSKPDFVRYVVEQNLYRA